MSRLPVLTARTQDAFIASRNEARTFELQRQNIVRRDMAANARAKRINALANAATFAIVFVAAVYFF